MSMCNYASIFVSLLVRTETSQSVPEYFLGLGIGSQPNPRQPVSKLPYPEGTMLTIELGLRFYKHYRRFAIIASGCNPFPSDKTPALRRIETVRSMTA